MFKKLFLAMFLLSSLPIAAVGCNKDEKKSEDSEKKKKDDSDDEDDKKSKKSKKKDEDSEDDDSKSKKKKKKTEDDDDDSKKKDEDGDSKKKDDSASDEDSTGLKECDKYLKLYMKCMPGDKATKEKAAKDLRKAYKQGAAVAAARDGVEEGCKKGNEAFEKTCK